MRAAFSGLWLFGNEFVIGEDIVNLHVLLLVSERSSLGRTDVRPKGECNSPRRDESFSKDFVNLHDSRPLMT